MDVLEETGRIMAGAEAMDWYRTYVGELQTKLEGFHPAERVATVLNTVLHNAGKEASGRNENDTELQDATLPLYFPPLKRPVAISGTIPPIQHTQIPHKLHEKIPRIGEKLQVGTVNVPIDPKFLDRPISIFFITDIHKEKDKPQPKQCIKAMCNWCRQTGYTPDLIFIGGDISENYDHEKTLKPLEFIREIAPNAPIIAVPGDHDPGLILGPNGRPTSSPQREKAVRLIEKKGIQVLCNGIIQYKIPGSQKTINVLGLDEPREGWQGLPEGYEELTENALTLGLCHHPVRGPVDIMFSGHLHLGWGSYSNLYKLATGLLPKKWKTALENSLLPKVKKYLHLNDEEAKLLIQFFHDLREQGIEVTGPHILMFLNRINVHHLLHFENERGMDQFNQEVVTDKWGCLINGPSVELRGTSSFGGAARAVHEHIGGTIVNLNPSNPDMIC